MVYYSSFSLNNCNKDLTMRFFSSPFRGRDEPDRSYELLRISHLQPPPPSATPSAGGLQAAPIEEEFSLERIIYLLGGGGQGLLPAARRRCCSDYAVLYVCAFAAPRSGVEWRGGGDYLWGHSAVICRAIVRRRVVKSPPSYVFCATAQREGHDEEKVGGRGEEN